MRGSKINSRGGFSCGTLDSTFYPKNINSEARAKLVAECSAASRVYARLLIENNWRIFVVDQSRGRCYYGDKVICVPLWIMTKQPGYAEYYLCHEMAHAFLHDEGKLHENHGPGFMSKFKKVCPEYLWHHELGYKPQNAAAAGIVNVNIFEEL